MYILYLRDTDVGHLDNFYNCFSEDRGFRVFVDYQFCIIRNGVTAQDLCVYTVSQGY